ncbi:Hsp70 family protein [Mycolicibacterium celeriflavum]|uniref:Hsp70 family protein n=1 Tax=Mycolicibacterium celeriflavum TaxID=1249101 RepID=UPI003CEC14EC
MFNHQATEDRPLGVSVGATNLTATRDGHTAVIRPSELTLNGQRLTGFVDRIGDPVPLIAPDGSAHRPERLLAEALSGLRQPTGDPQMAVAVPAHWRASVADTLRHALGDDVPTFSDATAALATLDADPGLPSRGVVVLCDFGGTGTNITLANASSGHEVVGETVRFADLSGDLVDQALLTQVMASLPSGADPSGTAVVGSLVRLRDECRAAKERLSAHTATAIPVDLPGHHAEVRVTRAELENRIRPAVTDFLAAVDETLERYGVPVAAVTAVATVGGGARIPMLTQQLSEHLRVPVVTTAQPQLAAAVGAALIAQRRRVVEPATTLTPTPAPTPAPTAIGPLAWSEDDQEDEPLPYTGSRPDLHFEHEEWQDEERPRRSPLVLFGLAAAAAMITTALFGAMQLRDDTVSPVDAATSLTPENAPPPTPAAPAPAPAPPASQAPQFTTIVVQPAQRSSAPQQRAPRTLPQTQAAPSAPPPTTAPPTTTPSPAEPETPTPPEPETPPVSEPEPETPPSADPPPIDPGPGNGEPPADTDPVDPDSSGDQTGTATVPDESSPTDGA